MDREQTLRKLIFTFRACGFEVGFTELCVADFEDEFVYGMTLTGPLDEICRYGPMPVEP